MIKRLKLCFILLTCKKYVFSDCKTYWNNEILTKDALDLAYSLNQIAEKTIIGETLLQEAKEILNN